MNQTGFFLRAGEALRLGEEPARNSIFANEIDELALDADPIGAKNARLIGRIGRFQRDQLIHQAVEFGVTAKQKLAALLIFITDVNSLGLQTAKGLVFTEAFDAEREEQPLELF